MEACCWLKMSVWECLLIVYLCPSSKSSEVAPRFNEDLNAISLREYYLKDSTLPC